MRDRTSIATTARISGAIHRFGLGALIRPPEPVPEAWTNELYQVGTVRGTFALKLFRPAAAPNVLEPRRSRLQAAMQVEAAALATGEVPMPNPVPLARSERWLAEIADPPGGQVVLARCHRWVEGTACSSARPSTHVAGEVARSLSAIHRLHLTPADSSQLPNLDLGRWHEALNGARRAGLAWAEELASLTPLIEDLAVQRSRLRASRLSLRGSHRDVDPKNAVLEVDGRVALTDWDAAGPALPWVEVVEGAVSFAGGPMAGDRKVIDAFLQAYLAAGARPQRLPPSTVAAASTDLGWLLRNVERCVSPASQNEHELAARLAPALVRSRPPEVRAMERWARYLTAKLDSSVG